VHPLDQAHIIVGWNDQLWIDHCMPFGATSSNGIFGRCGDALVHIMNARGFCPVTKWVDEFLFFRVPTTSPHNNTSFHYNESDIYGVAQELGWPWKPSKTCPFSSSFRYIGFDWDIPSRQVSIPTEKRLKFTQKISNWLSTTSVSLKDTQSLLGSVIHCALVIPEGHAHVIGLSRFTSTFPHAHSSCFLCRTRSARASEDATWWLTKLHRKDCFRILSPPPPLSPTPIYMDASTSFGVGITYASEFEMWKFIGAWQSDSRDIAWAEMVAIKLALQLLIVKGIQNKSVKFFSDNQGVIGTLKAGRSHNDQQNLVLQRIVASAETVHIHICIEYISTNDNPADAPSRGHALAHLSPTPQLPHLDVALVPFLTTNM
jgi:hypothetical protein